ncbi:hypothetical protein [Herbaspirillum sp. B65]|uniref:hypothetical protein n=1 Tax=Herbaspirillum sp. B65 TaxID=137708 RepID=UPI0020912AC3|nr:hypothetical protein [Herbaspirillum sp. B65]
MHAKLSPFSLWGLTLEAKAAPGQAPMQQTFIVRLGDEMGLLTFASALDAEIYCQHLAACGVTGWRRERLERIDVTSALATIPQQQQRLMLSLGFYASDTNDLLADDSQSLVTPLLPVQFNMRHRQHGLHQLRIGADIPAFVQHWWGSIGGENYGQQIGALERCSEAALTRCAADALRKIHITGISHYLHTWTVAGMAEIYALYRPDSGEWGFQPVSHEVTRQLH